MQQGDQCTVGIVRAVLQLCDRNGDQMFLFQLQHGGLLRGVTAGQPGLDAAGCVMQYLLHLGQLMDLLRELLLLLFQQLQQ